MKQFFRIFSLIFLSQFMVSCASYSKSLAKVKVHKEIDLKNKTDEALESRLFVEGNWPNEKWWEVFDDSQLSQFIEMGLKDNPSIASAEAKVRQVNQEAFVVRSKLFPKLTSVFQTIQGWTSTEGVSQTFPGIDPYLHLYQLTLNFDYEFDLWGKNRKLYEAAVGEMRVERAMSFQTKLILSTSIAKQYFALQANMAKMQVMLEILENRSKQLELANLRKINRIDNLINVNQIKQEVISFQETIAALKEELELEKSLLTTLMGKNPAESISLLSVWKQERKKITLPKELGLELLARRPDLMAEIWKVENAAKYVGVAIAEFYPNINLTGLGGFLNRNIDDLFERKSLISGLLPAVRLPLFEGGKLRANHKAKIAAYEAAASDYNDTLLKAANEVVSSITKLTSIDERLNYQEEEVKTRLKTYDLVFARFRHGIDSMLSVLQADEKYLWERIKQIELENNRTQSFIDLMKALGGGFNESDMKILKDEKENHCSR